MSCKVPKMEASQMALARQATERLKAVREWLSKPQNRLSVLLTCFLTLLAIFLVLLKNAPEGQRWLASWQENLHAFQAKEQLKQALLHDPPMGFSLVKAVGNIDDLPSISNPSSLLLVVLGSCEGCEEKVVMEWAETLGKWETWRKEQIIGALILQRGAEKVKKMVAEKGWKVTVIGDEDGKIAKALNACFVPRAYGFVEGELVWLQKKPKIGIVGVLEEFLRTVKGKERAAQVLNLWSAEMREKVWGKTAAGLVKGGDKR